MECRGDLRQDANPADAGDEELAGTAAEDPKRPAAPYVGLRVTLEAQDFSVGDVKVLFASMVAAVQPQPPLSQLKATREWDSLFVPPYDPVTRH